MAANVDQNFSCHISQIYVFKVVDIDCCEVCSKKLEKALGKLGGIQSVKVDATQSLVTVKGLIDPSEIIVKIKKLGKTAELVHERKETNPDGNRGGLNDEDEQGPKEEDLFNSDSSSRQKDSSRPRHKDSSFRHKFFSFGTRDKKKSSSHAPEKHGKSKSNASSPKEIPDHICRDKYCTFHRRDDSTASDRVPNINYGISYSPLYRGGGNYNYPRMNSYYGQPPPMYAPPPPQYGQYYGLRMFPPMAGYGGYAT